MQASSVADLRMCEMTGLMRLYRRIGEWCQSYRKGDRAEIDGLANWVGEYLDIYGSENLFRDQVAAASPAEVSRLGAPTPAELLLLLEDVYHIGQVLRRQHQHGEALDFRPYNKWAKLHHQFLNGGHDTIFQAH